MKKTHTTSLIAAPSWAWIFLALGFLLTFLFLMWVIFGRIPIIVSGRGIIISNMGLFSVQAHETGSIYKLLVKPQDRIKKGDFLMQIYDPELQLKYEKSLSIISLLSKQLVDLKQEIATEEKAYKDALKIKANAIRFNIAQLDEEISFGQKELKIRKTLVDEGLISISRYNEAAQGMSDKKIDRQNRIGDLAVVDADLKKEYRADEITRKSQQLQSEIEQRKILENDIEQGKIYSPYDGMVLEILANVGDLVQIGTPLLWLERLPSHEVTVQDYSIFAYFQVELGKKILPGTPVEMVVPNVNANQYGSITGVVKEVSLYAVSQEQLFSKIHNKSLIEFLTNQASAVVQVVIEPDRDPQHPEQFHWTSGEQPPKPISTGTVGTIEATVAQVRPLYYLIPIPSFKS